MNIKRIHLSARSPAAEAEGYTRKALSIQDAELWVSPKGCTEAAQRQEPAEAGRAGTRIRPPTDLASAHTESATSPPSPTGHALTAKVERFHERMAREWGYGLVWGARP